MRSQRAIIGIETQSAQVEIDQQEPDFELEIEDPKVRIESTLPQVQISQQQAFSESGLKGVLELTYENAQIAKQLLLGGIQRVSQQGDQMADISKPDPLPDQAKYNAWDQFKKDYNIATMPESGPDIEVIEGVNDIQVQEGHVENKTKTAYGPLIEYTPGSVRFYMQQYPNLEIWTVGSNLDLKA
jgi:hypothetical protein